MTNKIKIVCGYRKDQQYSVSVDEAHKAYYLFYNPDARTVFSDGLALKGSQIDSIVPDYQGSMGWNPEHILGPDDWNELHSKMLPSVLRSEMSRAQEVARTIMENKNEKDLNLKMPQILQKYPQLAHA